MEFEFNNTLRELLELRLNTIKKRKFRQVIFYILQLQLYL